MWVQIVGHITYLLIALSYTLRDIVWLRVVAVMASCTSIVFNFVAPETPLWLPINWNIVFLFVNLVELFRIYRDRQQRELTSEETQLATTIFHKLSLLDASRLLRAGEWKTLKAGETLARVGEDLYAMTLVVEGAICIETPSGRRQTRHATTFVGEVSFVTGEAASATVMASTDLRCIQWPFEALHAVMAKSPKIAVDLQRIISSDLSEKLRNQSDDTLASQKSKATHPTDLAELSHLSN